MTTTAIGDELATLINPIMGTTRDIRRTCATIAEHAATYQALCILDCNQGLDDDERANQAKLEEQIANEVNQLPEGDKDGQTLKASIDFGGDPRGYCVKLFFNQRGTIDVPSVLYNTWGGSESGLGVPTDDEAE